MTTFKTDKSSSIAEVQNLPQISETELCDRYQKLYGGLVNDTLRELGYLHQTLPNDIMPLRDHMCLAGIAFTVRGRKSTETEGEMEQRAQMLDAIHPNSVVVWDTHRDDESAHWGEVMTKAAIRGGCRGAVVDGGVRDTHLVLVQNFPVFARYRSSNGMLGRFRMIDYQQPITMGHVMVYPGDIVFADIDGVIIVPRKLAVQVLLRSEEIRGEEQIYKQWIDDGMSPEEVVKRGGYF